MKPIYIPAKTPDDWKSLLADPEKKWHRGYSARTLAHCWHDCANLPPEVEQIFRQSNIPAVKKLEMLFAFPEHEVHLPPTQGHPSQNDLFVVARDVEGSLVTIMVEGKVSEPFGETLGNWYSSPTRGKITRLNFIKELLGLQHIPEHIRYQLLHRTASAVIEAGRLNARHAVMLVHSFNQENAWLDDYCDFLELFGKQGGVNTLVHLREVEGIQLYAGWAKGNAKYLES